MKVFISYSTQDTATVREFAKAVEECGDHVFWWRQSKRPGKDAWPTIFEWIEESNLVLALITDKTLKRAMAVGNEIGYAKANDITVIPILGDGVDSDGLGCLIGLTHIRLREDRLDESIQEVLDAMDDEQGDQRRRAAIRFLTALGASFALNKLLEK